MGLNYMKKLFVIFGLLITMLASSWAKPEGDIISVPANPKAGFEWGYLLYIPRSIDTSKTLPILFTMNDSGSFNSVEELEQATRKRFGRGNEDYIAYEVGVPMVLPLINRTKGEVNAHDYNRAVFVLREGPLKRLDLQVLAMIKDARKRLKEKGIHTQRKFLVNGFSSAGSFGGKLALMHPEEILAVVNGGEHYATLPLESLEGIPLIYPIGVYDFQEYLGKKFNKKAWLKIPMLVTNGEDDYNDPLPYSDVYGEEDRALTLKIYGEGTVQDRLQRVGEMITKYAPNIQWHVYPHVDHAPIHEDIITFLKVHLNGGPLKPIALTDTSTRPTMLPLHVTKIYWGEEAKSIIPEKEWQYLGTEEINLYVAGTFPFWGWKAHNCRFDVLADGIIVLENKPCRGMFTIADDAHLVTVPFSNEDMQLLTKNKATTYTLRSRFPKVWEVPSDLTFTVSPR